MSSPSDPRRGLSSASKVEQDTLCRGSFLAQRSFPRVETTEATKGTERHELEEKQVPLQDISDDEDRECSRRARHSLQHIRDILKAEKGTIIREKRFWLMDKDNQPLMSGQIDYLEFFEDKALIADYKMLYGVHASAPRNMQLSAYATLVSANHPEINHVYAALIEPFGEPMLSTTSYTKEQLVEEAEKLRGIYEEIYSGTAKRTAGNRQCKFCRALGVCDKAHDYIMNLVGKIKI